MTSTSTESGSKLYFGDSLEDVLPEIRAELGPDALIVRQREGIVGGIGGFFGRKCVEVEARAAAPPSPLRSLPAHSIIDVYDTVAERFDDSGAELTQQVAPELLSVRAVGTFGEETTERFHDSGDERRAISPAEPSFPLPELESPESTLHHDAGPATGRGLTEMLREQSSPFALSLASALAEAAPEEPAAAATNPEPPPLLLGEESLPSLAEMRPAPQATDWAPAPLPPLLPAEPAPLFLAAEGALSAPVSTLSAPAADELDALRSELLTSLVPVGLADTLLGEATDALAPQAPGTALRELVRRSLGKRIPVPPAQMLAQRRIAIIGPRGVGRTLATASLAFAYVRGGHSVTAISLEPTRRALALELLLSDIEADFEIAASPGALRRSLATLAHAEVVIADTPPLMRGREPGAPGSIAALLAAFEPDEVHLVLPAGLTLEAGRSVLSWATGQCLPLRIIVSRIDSEAASGVAVGLSLALGAPITFVGGGSSVGAFRPANPARLAEMVLP
jgi:flagellar biosynthesis GTPase FlhF